MRQMHILVTDIKALEITAVMFQKTGVTLQFEERLTWLTYQSVCVRVHSSSSSLFVL